jgi:hypothetical protein
MSLKAWGRGCLFSTTEPHTQLWRCPAIVEHGSSRNMDQTSRADCLASSVTGWIFSLLEHVKEFVQAVAPRTTEDHVARPQAAVTTVRCQNVKACSGECHAAARVCLEMDGGRFEHCCSFFQIPWGGVRLSPLCTSATNLPIAPAPDDRLWWVWSSGCNENMQERKPKYSEKTCPSATLSTTNLTWPDVGSNLYRRGWKPATNHLSLHVFYIRDIHGLIIW